ncbi:Zinc finger, CCHC-type [Sesbania bispinosa]|nr:Zinc finger, CCHC-type [Sesbania bispinosa]
MTLIEHPSENQDDNEVTVELEDNGIDSLQLAKRSIVCKVLAPKPLNKTAVKGILIKAWGEPKDIQITDMGINTFLFIFNDGNEVKEVMKKAPWFVMGYLTSLQFWIPEASIFEIDFSITSFWAQIHGLPLDIINTSNAAKIMGKFGDVLEVENPMVSGILARTFIRVSVRIDIRKPIPTGCWVPRRALPKLWVFFRFEKLQGICYNCGIIGHEQKNCKETKIMAPFNPALPKYGPSLSVPPAKQLSQILHDQQLWRKQKQSAMETSNQSDTTGEKVVDRQDLTTEQNKAGKAPATIMATGDTTTQTSNTQQKDTAGDPLAVTAETRGPVCTIPDTERMSINEGMRRASLGPQHLQQFGVEKEFIGLQNRVVILDYPSPPSGSNEFRLTAEQILHCREACKSKPKFELPSHSRDNQHADKQKEPMGNSPIPEYQTEQKQAYFVEFPEEDDQQELQTRTTNLKVQHSIEKQLISGWNKVLSIKRFREEQSEQGEWQQREKTGEYKGEKTKGDSLGPYLAPPPTMSWLCWNCRGMGAASTIRELRDLCKVYKPALIFLSETRAAGNKVIDLKRKLRFHHSFSVDVNGLSGGLCLLWDKTLEILPTQNLWDTLQPLHLISTHPWCCMGDFNEVLSQAEKVGLRPSNTAGINLFRNFLDQSDLMDLELKGCKFTWTSNPRDDFVTREKLDRVLVNWAWRTDFPNAMALALPAVSSDHSPIIFWPVPPLSSGNSFKYEFFWEDHEQCNDVIKEGWQGNPEKDCSWRRATSEECFQITRLLNTFSNSLGLRVNLGKSGLIFGKKVSQSVRTQLQNILRMDEWPDPGRYLGRPGDWDRSRVNNLGWIRERIRGKLEG